MLVEKLIDILDLHPAACGDAPLARGIDQLRLLLSSGVME